MPFEYGLTESLNSLYIENMDQSVRHYEPFIVSGPKYCCFEIGVATSNEPQILFAVEFKHSPGECQRVGTEAGSGLQCFVGNNRF
jgi:hypothetical protein